MSTSDAAVQRIRVSGRVQGVGFRWFVREQACALGLAGWVRNEPDGSVLLEVAGDADALATLLRTVAVGPSRSEVEAMMSEPPHTPANALPRPFAIAP